MQRYRRPCTIAVYMAFTLQMLPSRVSAFALRSVPWNNAAMRAQPRGGAMVRCRRLTMSVSEEERALGDLLCQVSGHPPTGACPLEVERLCGALSGAFTDKRKSRARVEGHVWECLWPRECKGIMWSVHPTARMGKDMSNNSMREFYSSMYSPKERRRLIVGYRGSPLDLHGANDLCVRFHTVIAPQGLGGYYHVPSRQGAKDNSVVYVDPTDHVLVMLNPWFIVGGGESSSFMVCRRQDLCAERHVLPVPSRVTASL